MIELISAVLTHPEVAVAAVLVWLAAGAFLYGFFDGEPGNAGALLYVMVLWPFIAAAVLGTILLMVLQWMWSRTPWG